MSEKQNNKKKGLRASDELSVIKIILDENPPLKDRVLTVLRTKIDVDKAMAEYEKQSKSKQNDI